MHFQTTLNFRLYQIENCLNHIFWIRNCYKSKIMLKRPKQILAEEDFVEHNVVKINNDDIQTAHYEKLWINIVWLIENILLKRRAILPK